MLTRMNRRAFLHLVSMAAPAMALDPERLLWTPKPMIVVPALPTAGVNSLLTFDHVLREALQVLEHNLIFASDVNRSYKQRISVGPLSVRTRRRLR